MNQKLIELLIAKAEELGWRVIVDEKTWEFQKYSPAGEDFWISISGKDVVDELLDWYEGFDPEDHVMMHMEAKKHGVSGVPSLKELVEDADAIDEMIEELYDALHAVEESYYEESDSEDDDEESNCENGTYICEGCTCDGDCPRQVEEGENGFDCCVYISEIRYGAVHLEGVHSEEEAKKLAEKAYKERRIDWHSEEISDMTVDKN